MGNQVANADDSQSDPHTEAEIFRSQTTQKFGPVDDHYMVTGVIQETHGSHDMVTGATEQIRNR